MPTARALLRTTLPLLALSALLLATIAAYTPGLDGPFLLDDAANIQPAQLREMSWDEVRANAFANDRLAGLSRSIGILSLAITEYLHGPNPRAFKRENLLLHLANGLLVFWFIRLLFLTRPRFADEAASWAAVAVAALWLLHPLQISTVLYIVQRLVLLSAFFSLLALCCYLEGRILMRQRLLAGTTIMLLGLLVFWPLALISKENAALLIIVIPLLEWFILNDETADEAKRQVIRVILSLFFLVPLILGIAYISLHADNLTSTYAGRDFNLSERLMTETHVIWFYLKLIALPNPGLMSLFHDGFPVQRTLDANTFAAGSGILAVIIIAFLLRTRAPLIGFGLLWYFSWHALESTFIPLELVFEHRNYVALIGLLLALVSAISPLFKNIQLRLPLASLSLALILILALNTAARAFTWSGFELMVTSEYENNNRSPRVLEGMTVVAISLGRETEALRYVKELQVLSPDDAYPVIREILLRCDSPSLAEAPIAAAMQLARTGRVSPGTVNLTRSLISRTLGGDCPAVDNMQVVNMAEALTRNPRVKDKKTQLAVLSTLAMAAIMTGDKDTAATALKTMIATARTFSQSKFADSIEAAAQVASELDSMDDAIEFLDGVTSDYADVLERRKIHVFLNIVNSRQPHSAPE